MSIEGLLRGTAYGDALGIPFENKTYDELIAVPRVPAFTKVQGHPFIDEKDFSVGQWTDDTQLTMALCRGLRHAQAEYPFPEIVAEHIVEWRRSLNGWGGTRTAIERLSNGCSPDASGNKGAIGNGVLMKLTPMAVFFSRLMDADIEAKAAGRPSPDGAVMTTFERRVKTWEALCVMSHDTDIAIVTAAVHGEMLVAHFLEHTSTSGRRGIAPTSSQRSLHSGRQDVAASTDVSRKLAVLHAGAAACESFKARFPDAAAHTMRRLKGLELSITTATGGKDDTTSSDDEKAIVALSEGGTFHCLNSLTMVWGILLWFPRDDPLARVLRAAYIGGDTDSNASMVGGVLGYIHGCDWLQQPAVLGGKPQYGEELLLDAVAALTEGLAVALKVSPSSKSPPATSRCAPGLLVVSGVAVVVAAVVASLWIRKSQR